MKRALVFLFLTSILIRLWFAIGYWSDKPLTHDSQEYLELARSFNATGTFTYKTHSTTQIESYGRAPAYPLWLAFLLKISPTLAWIRLAEVIVSLITLYIFFLLARELFGLRIGLVAFVLCSLYVPFIWLIPSILSENVWLALILSSYWFLLRSRVPRRRLYFHMSVLILAAATLVRPASFFLLPFYIVWAVRFANWRTALIAMGLYCLALAPWNWYLYRQEGRFIFIASEGGVTFWTGTHPFYSGDGDLSVNPPVQKDYRELLKAYAYKTPAEREKIYVKHAFQNILNNPIGYLFIELKKLFFWFAPAGNSVIKSSRLHQITTILFYFPVLVGAVVGFKRLARHGRLLVVGVVVSFTIMILVFFPQERFRIVCIDPVLLLISSNELVQRFGTRLIRL